MSQNLQNFVKFQKFQLENLVDFEKCCKTHIFLQKSVPIQPKTSNILPKFCQKLATTLRVRRPCHRDELEWVVQYEVLMQVHGAWIQKVAERAAGYRECIFRKCIFRKFCKFLAGSFSAVSKRNFARKYAFDSIFQALQDLHPFAPLQSQNFRKKSV